MNKLVRFIILFKHICIWVARPKKSPSWINYIHHLIINLKINTGMATNNDNTNIQGQTAYPLHSEKRQFEKLDSVLVTGTGGWATRALAWGKTV